MRRNHTRSGFAFLLILAIVAGGMLVGEGVAKLCHHHKPAKAQHAP